MILGDSFGISTFPLKASITHTALGENEVRSEPPTSSSVSPHVCRGPDPRVPKIHPRPQPEKRKLTDHVKERLRAKNFTKSLHVYSHKCGVQVLRQGSETRHGLRDLPDVLSCAMMSEADGALVAYPVHQARWRAPNSFADEETAGWIASFRIDARANKDQRGHATM